MLVYLNYYECGCLATNLIIYTVDQNCAISLIVANTHARGRDLYWMNFERTFFNNVCGYLHPSRDLN